MIIERLIGCWALVGALKCSITAITSDMIWYPCFLSAVTSLWRGVWCGQIIHSSHHTLMKVLRRRKKFENLIKYCSFRTNSFILLGSSKLLVVISVLFLKVFSLGCLVWVFVSQIFGLLWMKISRRGTIVPSYVPISLKCVRIMCLICSKSFNFETSHLHHLFFQSCTFLLFLFEKSLWACALFSEQTSTELFEWKSVFGNSCYNPTNQHTQCAHSCRHKLLSSGRKFTGDTPTLPVISAFRARTLSSSLIMHNGRR